MNTKLFSSLAGALALAAMSSVALAQTVEVKLGFAGPLTGAQAQYGKDMQNGIVLAIEEMNATNPKIGGKNVKFVLQSEDDQADPRTGAQVAQKLVDSGIKGMLGHFNSGTTIPASAIYNKAGIPQVAMATAPEYTQQGFKNTFRMMTSDTQQGAVIGAYAVKGLSKKKIVVIDDRTAYGQGLADEFEKAAKAAGGTIVMREFTNDKAQDFKSILTKVKAKNPDAIFFGGVEAQSAAIVKQMKELKINAVFMSGETTKTDNFLKIAGVAAEGSVASLAGLPLDQMPGGNAYVAKYKKRFNENVQTYSPYAYDGAMALMAAMKRADSIEPAKYLPALARTTMSGVTSSKIAYDAKGDLKDGGITVYQVKQGAWVPLPALK